MTTLSTPALVPHPPPPGAHSQTLTYKVLQILEREAGSLQPNYLIGVVCHRYQHLLGVVIAPHLCPSTYCGYEHLEVLHTPGGTGTVSGTGSGVLLVVQVVTHRAGSLTWITHT